MIYDSSKNYLDRTITLVFDGNEPSSDDIKEYCIRNYGEAPASFDIDPEHEGLCGYTNPGIVKVQLPWKNT
jgi:hypothetical protein